MACGCKSKNQTTTLNQTNLKVSTSPNTTSLEVKIQEQQNKRIVEAIMTKLSV
jgi:hypothetical protein